ncbi:MAG TPA: SH3-like domain-containing protein [Candidatus Binatia bacterium]|jgi:nitrile hydratase
MGRAVSAAPGRFKPGDRVRVRMEDRPGHIRTPYYIRGKTGWIERVHGEFRNPESLAYGRDGLPKRSLYLVGFHQAEVWQRYGAPKDKLFIDIYEHWLDPA